MAAAVPSPRRRLPRVAQRTARGLGIPMARRGEFYSLLERVADSGLPAPARGARARRLAREQEASP